MARGSAWVKPAVDFGPLAVFFLAYKTAGILVATAALMAATVVAVGLAYAHTRRWPLVPVVTAVIVGVFGGLTLWLKDDSFIKMKPSIIYALFAAVLAGGLAFDRPLLKSLLSEAMPPLSPTGWRALTLRFTGFFLAMAGLNEVARRILTTDQWVLWKVAGCVALTFAFILAQTPLIRRHRLESEPAAEPAGE